MSTSRLVTFLIRLEWTMLVLSTSSMDLFVSLPLSKLISVFLSPCWSRLSTLNRCLTYAFIATLRRFIARRGKPSLMWSNHSTNFVGAHAVHEMKELIEFLKQQKAQEAVSNFCLSQNIEWKFIPEHAPHFGALWVKSVKMHLRCVTTGTKPHIWGLNSRDIDKFVRVGGWDVVKWIFPSQNTMYSNTIREDKPQNWGGATDSIAFCHDGIEALTPGHFLIGRPLESIPDPSFSYRSVSLLHQWHLCQSLVQHFWKRWSTEYLITLRWFAKWNYPSRNTCVGDIVVLQEDGLVPTKWPLTRVMSVHPGKDGLVRVVTVKTHTGTYKCPITKVATLLLLED